MSHNLQDTRCRIPLANDLPGDPYSGTSHDSWSPTLILTCFLIGTRIVHPALEQFFARRRRPAERGRAESGGVAAVRLPALPLHPAGGGVRQAHPLLPGPAAGRPAALHQARLLRGVAGARGPALRRRGAHFRRRHLRLQAPPGAHVRQGIRLHDLQLRVLDK
ncbi:hypothetical protein AVEN_72068-1 [Araneus ventricosus]|uniref:Uncharacterized protein n=1 Tax=Araneus ventricosus TaxID=182803 RepID=A0A4Y2T9X2_ARAVE|nr:hypothetical protein AVEN_72068-1 [Araneus ventricosus]